jgi:hypothetical protein
MQYRVSFIIVEQITSESQSPVQYLESGIGATALEPGSTSGIWHRSYSLGAWFNIWNLA